MKSAPRLFALLAAAVLLVGCGEADDEPVARAPTEETVAAPPADVAAVAAAASAPVAPPVPAPPPAEARAEPTPAPALNPEPPAAPVAEPPVPALNPEPLAAAVPAPEPLAAPAPQPPVPPAAPAPALALADTAPDLALRDRIAAADLQAGTQAAAACGICHTFAAGEAGRIGPNLHDVVGAAVARSAFDYSPALRALGDGGATWTFERLDAFLADPAGAAPGNRMSFTGLPDPTARAALILYLRSLAAEPVPVVGPAPATPAAIAVAPIYTASQAAAGAGLYVRTGCRECHGANLRGEVDMREGGFGAPPALVGVDFAARWFDRPAGDLAAYLREEKPMTAPGTIADPGYAELLAFILEANGIAAGDAPLPTDAAALGALRIR